jgi:hypothetical protein
MNKIYYYHGYFYDCKARNDDRFTIAGQYNSTLDILELNIAICSNKDQFNKKVGRELATNRLTGGEPGHINLNIMLNENLMWYNKHSYKPFAKYMLDNISKFEGLIFNEVVKGIIVDCNDELINLKKRFNIK